MHCPGCQGWQMLLPYSASDGQADQHCSCAVSNAVAAAAAGLLLVCFTPCITVVACVVSHRPRSLMLWCSPIHSCCSSTGVPCSAAWVAGSSTQHRNLIASRHTLAVQSTISNKQANTLYPRSLSCSLHATTGQGAHHCCAVPHTAATAAAECPAAMHGRLAALGTGAQHLHATICH